MGETGVFAAKRALCGRSDAIPQHATSPPDSNGEKNHRRPQETGVAKPKEICESILTLRAEFPAHSAITCPVRGLKKSLRYARLCREARRNPAGAPTRGQQHLQMPFRNPDFQRRRPFPQTFPRGQTETADSPAPIRRKPAENFPRDCRIPPARFRAQSCVLKLAPSFSHRPVSPRRHSSPTGESANWRPLRPDAAR